MPETCDTETESLIVWNPQIHEVYHICRRTICPQRQFLISFLLRLAFTLEMQSCQLSAFFEVTFLFHMKYLICVEHGTWWFGLCTMTLNP